MVAIGLKDVASLPCSARQCGRIRSSCVSLEDHQELSLAVVSMPVEPMK